MITGHDIVCISSIDWDFIWQGHQEIMATFAANGNRVLFLENTGVRPPRVRDIGRLRSRLRNWRRGTQGFREERPNLFVLSPVVLPFPYSRLARWVNRTLLLRSLRRWMRAAHFGDPIVWTFLPTPLARDLIRELDPKLTVYYCIDDLASSSPAARRITETENEVFREADLVFVTSEKLRERAARFNPNVHFFPFAVSYERFERVREGSDANPADVQSLAKPVIGYVGGLHQWVDQGLVGAVADAMPEASVVLVGPAQTDVSELERRGNVHLLGARAHAEVPRYIKAFDVAMVPYRLADYTSHVYPTKLNEYLAMGKPVVATDLLEIRRFNDAHGDVIRIGAEPQAFVEAVRAAMADTAPAAEAQRIAVARENSWSTRIGRMSALMNAKLADRPARERWDVALRRLYRGARVRALQVLAVLAMVYLLLFATPALWWIASPLHLAATPERADAIVVFGGGVGESGERGGGYEERVKQAIDLYRSGVAPVIVFSSGYVYTFREAEVMQALALSNGVPASAIVLETRAASTRENVLFTRDIAAAKGWHHVLLVSSPYHMRRALLTWRRNAPDIEATPTPVPVAQSGFYAHRVGASLDQMRGIAHEYAALAWYWIKGWI